MYTMSIKFDYDVFYQYYTNINNLLIDNNPPITFFYIRTNVLDSNETSPRFFIYINNIAVYITYLSKHKQEILFSIPTIINNKVYDNHYHFGIEKKDERTKLFNLPEKPQKNIDTIYFHKSTQVPSISDKERKDCWFRNGTHITDVSDIICTQLMSCKMRDKFNFDCDLAYINEIISRPFLNNGGRKRRILNII